MNVVKKVCGLVLIIWGAIRFIPDSLESAQATAKYTRWLYNHFGVPHNLLLTVAIVIIGIGLIFSESIQKKLSGRASSKEKGGANNPQLTGFVEEFIADAYVDLEESPLPIQEPNCWNVLVRIYVVNESSVPTTTMGYELRFSVGEEQYKGNYIPMPYGASSPFPGKDFFAVAPQKFADFETAVFNDPLTRGIGRPNLWIRFKVEGLATVRPARTAEKVTVAITDAFGRTHILENKKPIRLLYRDITFARPPRG